ncbi:uncharacterized protein BCR38DRAFT_387645 [Pseudomassariella vexata]|uniref:DUF427 domain-containing protein n=1 Tax=Pseudomassariella vexata TaxID=1141098 RepID=A0A1Y2E6S7_9PEZI|nr:uncharacterized protein BCR38DRAFT_387645 [Pseudomassariella vexata]ORY67219.1 hypothetical protein BCR38DRAFT_387645 [Pseudomassariella vexata]
MASPVAKPDLLELGNRLLKEGPVKTLPTPRRIRILFNGVYVADTTTALYLWEHPHYPYYYIPLRSFLSTYLINPDDSHVSTVGEDCNDSSAGVSAPVSVVKLNVGRRSTDRILLFGDRKHLPEGREELANMVRVEFSVADAWFEEDMRIYVHPKDPFKRVDIVPSTRLVRVFIDGTLVASTTTSHHLYETSLPVRYYVPLTSVKNLAWLRESDTRTECPYKGEARYYDVVLPRGIGEGERQAEMVVKDVVWYYRAPTLESATVAGLLCFYNEQVDIELDGVRLARPVTHFK